MHHVNGNRRQRADVQSQSITLHPKTRRRSFGDGIDKRPPSEPQVAEDEYQGRHEANHPIFREELQIIIMRIDRVGLNLRRTELSGMILVCCPAGSDDWVE